ncbi:MAG: hypothetical protein KDD73_16445 [Anaerolineales bacterium]|nr:hypothetical protein [Anaerolineales bacterium]
MGRMLIGTFDALSEVVLTRPDGSETPCETTSLPTDDPAGDAWEFTCSLPELAMAQGFYRLPLRVTLGTTAGEQVSSEGALVGSWEQLRLDEDSIAVEQRPLPQWLSDAIAANEDSRTLLTAHRPVSAIYEGRMLPDAPPRAGSYRGEIVWAGWREHDGHQIPYMVASAFSYEAGELWHWSLTADKATTLADDVIAQPLTERLLAEHDRLTLNLWYDELLERELPKPTYLMNGGDFGAWEVGIGRCAGLPGPTTLPSSDEPLRAFGVNGDGFLPWLGVPFVLLEGQTVVKRFDFWPQYESDTISENLLPTFFRDDAPPFEGIWQESTDIFTEGPTITVSLPDDADPAQRVAASDFVAQLPGRASTEWGPTRWEIPAVTFAVDDQGYLVIHDCDPSD